MQFGRVLQILLAVKFCGFTEFCGWYAPVDRRDCIWSLQHPRDSVWTEDGEDLALSFSIEDDTSRYGDGVPVALL